MYQTHKTYIKADSRMPDLIRENPQILLLLEHLEIDFVVGDMTVSQLCREHNIPIELFLVFGNLYNGFFPDRKEIRSIKDIMLVIRFLKRNHHYYVNDKYPEIIGYIKELQDVTGDKGVKLIEKFFQEYFSEVLDHLDYEDRIAFPYFIALIENRKKASVTDFSVHDYQEHHTDIETKLSDLKNLLLKHIHIHNELSIRRRLFFALLELEFDLNIHSLIEETILLPLIAEVEKRRPNE